MPIEVDAGAAGIIEFPDGTTDDAIKAWFNQPDIREQLESDGFEYPEEPSALGGGIASGIGLMKAAAGLPFEMAGRNLGITDIEQYGADIMKGGIEQMMRNPPRVGRVEDIDWANLDDALAYIAYGFGSSLPSIAASIVGATAGGLAGAPGGPAGIAAGAVGGAFAPSYLLNTTETFLQLKEKGITDDVAALASGIPQALLDVFTPTKIAGKLFWKPVRNELIEDLRKRGLLKGIGAETLKTGFGEGLTETAQDLVRAGTVAELADEPLLTNETLSDMLNSFVLGAAVGGGIGGATAAGVGAFTGRTAPDLTGMPISVPDAPPEAVETPTPPSPEPTGTNPDKAAFDDDYVRIAAAVMDVDSDKIPLTAVAPAQTLYPDAHTYKRAALQELTARRQKEHRNLARMQGRFDADERRGTFANKPDRAEPRAASLENKINEIKRLDSAIAKINSITPVTPSTSVDTDTTGLVAMGNGMSGAISAGLRDRLWDEYTGKASSIDSRTAHARTEVPGMSREQFLQWYENPTDTERHARPDNDLPRLYHGTGTTEKSGGAIRTFKPSKDGALGAGIYLTPKADRASGYAAGTALGEPREGGYVLPVYADIHNPLKIDGSIAADPMTEALIRLGETPARAEKIVEKAYDNKGYISTEVRSRAQKAGYDGILQYHNGELNEVVVWDPAKVKSATTERQSRGEDFSNLQQKLPEIMSALARRMKQLGVDDAFRVRVFDSMTSFYKGEQRPIQGRYFAKVIDVSLLAKGGPVMAFNHEVIHGLRAMNAFTKEEWAILEDAARNVWMDRYKIQTKYSDEHFDVQLEEAIAHAFAHWSAGLDVMPTKNLSLIERVFETIRTFLQQIWHASRDAGVTSWEQLFANIDSGSIARRNLGNNLLNYEKAGLELITKTKFEHFNNWFDKSKVVDAFGRPLQVWHGTHDIDQWHSREFQHSMFDIGFHFGTKSAANVRLYGLRRDANIFKTPNLQRTKVFKTQVQQLAGRARNAAKKRMWQSLVEFAEQAERENIKDIDAEAVNSMLASSMDYYSPYLTDLKKHLGWHVTSGHAMQEYREFTMPFFLSIQNPLTIKDAGSFQWKRIIGLMRNGHAEHNIPMEELALLERIILKDTHEKFPKESDAIKRIGYGNKLLRDALMNHYGYDGLRYFNDIETAGGDGNYSYVAFSPNQIKSVFNHGTYDWGRNDFMYSRFNEDPADHESNGYPGPATAQMWKSETNKVKRLVESIEDHELPQVPKDMSRPAMFLSSMLNSAHRSTLFARMFMPIRKLTEFRMKVVNESSELIKPLGALNKAEYELFRKAAEISQLVPGEHTPDERGRYVFTAPPEGGRGVGSPLLPNEVVVLEGKTALAFEATQKALNQVLTEIRNAWMSRQYDTMKTILDYMGLNADGRFEDPAAVEELTYGDLAEMLSELQGMRAALDYNLPAVEKPATDEERAALDIMRERQRLMTRMEEDLAPIVRAQGRYEGMLKQTYVPFSRFGEYFIEVKQPKINEDGTPGALETVWFEFIEVGRWEPKAVIQKRINRRAAELRQRYPDAQISPSLQQASWDYLKRQYNMEASLDAAIQFLSSNTAKQYASIREEIIKNIGSKGFMTHMEHRTNLPGYSTDFKRSIANYIMGGAALAARLRYQPDIDKAMNVIRSREGTPNLREYSEEVYQYVMNPQEEWQWTRAFMFAWHLGVNVSSALLQTMSLVQFVGPELTKYAPTHRVVAELGKAATEAGRIIGKSTVGIYTGSNPYKDSVFNHHMASPDVAPDLNRAVLEGVVKQYAVLEQSGISSSGSSLGLAAGMRNFETSAMQVLATPFNTVEMASRTSAFIAAWRLAQDPAVLKRADEILSGSAWWQVLKEDKKGEPMTPYDFAAFVVEDNFGLYGKLNRPRYQRGFGALLFQFKSYVHFMFEKMLRDGDMYGGPGRQAFGFTLLALLLTGGLMSLPGAEDTLDLMEFFSKQISGVDPMIRLQMREMINDLPGIGSQFAAELIERGLPNALGMDVQRRISMGEAPMADFVKALLGVRGDIGDLLGVPGSAVLTNSSSFFSLVENGRWDAAMAHAMPVFLKNFYEATYLYPRYGIRSQKGTQILTPEQWADTSKFSRAMKPFGFTPTDISHAREKIWYQDRLNRALQPLQERFTNRLADAIAGQYTAAKANDRDGMRDAQNRANEIMRAILEHNSKVSDPSALLSPTILTNARMKAILRVAPELGIKRLRKLARARGQEIGELYDD